MNLTKFDEEFIKFLISSKESKSLDFKQKVTSKEKIARTIGAMANTEGGYILIGLSDQKKLIGVDPEEEKFMIESANELYCTPRVSLSCESIVWQDSESEKKSKDEIYLLLVTIKKSEGPQIFTSDRKGNRRLFVRVDDQTRSIP